jgi:hypothetical protein
MIELTYSLKQFPSPAPLPNWQITSTLLRQLNFLTICYELEGDIAQIELPPAAIPTRQEDLWEKTCFEFFLAIASAPNYWEFNLSPNGDWNVYRFKDYRQGMEEEHRITTLPFQVSRQSGVFKLELALDLGLIMPREADLEIGITTVIRTKSGEISYWGLTHCGTQPDFHLRDSFMAISR